MRSLLRERQITIAPEFEAVIDDAWRIHYAREPESATSRPVSDSSLLAAAARADSRVRDVLERHGLRFGYWLNLLNISEPAAIESLDTKPPLNYLIGASALERLAKYARDTAQRPLDAITLAAYMLDSIGGRGRVALVEAGLENIEDAAAELYRMIDDQGGQRDEPLLPGSQLERFELSETVRRLLRAATALANEYRAPLTTSVMIVAISRATDDTSTFGDAGQDIRGDTGAEELEKRVREWMLWYRVGGGLMTPALRRVFDTAQALAEATTRLRVIHGRHLLGALLSIPATIDAGVGDVLRWLGAPTEQELLRRLWVAVESMIARKVLADDPEAWRAFVDAPPPSAEPRHLLATVDLDQSGGKDLLNFSRDVRAFATLIAAKNLKPPLSIGLFGNWGSGKSFFMDQLRDEVAKLAVDAESAGYATGFHTRIVQIKFNAWHYVEGNLWASLVEHLFRNLKLSDDEPENVTLERRRFFLTKLDDAVARRAAAEAKIRDAEAQRDALATRVDHEVQAANSVAANLTAALRVGARDLIELSDDEKKTVGRAARGLGFDRIGAAAGSTAEAVDKLRTLGGRGWQLWQWLTRGPGRTTRALLLAAALILPIVITAAARWLAAKLGSNPDVAAVITGLVTILGALTTAVKRIHEKFKPLMAEFERARDVAKKAFEKAEAERSEKLKALQGQQERVQKDLDAARSDMQASEQSALDAKKELEQLSDDRQLVRSRRHPRKRILSCRLQHRLPHPPPPPPLLPRHLLLRQRARTA